MMRNVGWGQVVGVLANYLANAILTTVNDNCLARNEGRIIARQKENCAGDISRFSQPLDGLLAPGAAFLFVRLW